MKLNKIGEVWSGANRLLSDIFWKKNFVAFRFIVIQKISYHGNVA